MCGQAKVTGWGLVSGATRTLRAPFYHPDTQPAQDYSLLDFVPLWVRVPYLGDANSHVDARLHQCAEAMVLPVVCT